MLFFKCLFDNWARAVVFKLDEGIIHRFVKFNYQSSSIEKEQPLDKITNKV